MIKFYIDEKAIVSKNAVIGIGSSVWINAQVREGARIGTDCVISKDVYIDHDVYIGNSVKIQNGVSVFHGVTIEDDVFVGPNAVFTNDLVPRAFNEDWKITTTLIQKGASIGANATIICGNTIGEFAMIGAGSLVNRNVPDHALVVGNPARLIGYVCECGQRLDKHNHCQKCNRDFII